jgi:hypothetical protein
MRRSLMTAAVMGASLIALVPVSAAAAANSDSPAVSTSSTSDPGRTGEPGRPGRQDHRTFKGWGWSPYMALENARTVMRFYGCREERSAVDPAGFDFKATVWAECG